MKALNIGLAVTALTLTATNFSNNIIPYTNLYETKLIYLTLEEKPVLSFSSSVRFGKQENQLSVLVSTDFNGEYTEESVKKASWVSIANDIKLATSEEIVQSGEIDLQAIVKGKKTYYIAFKYTGNESTEGKPTQRTWTVNQVKIGSQDLTSFNIVNSAINDEKTGWVKTSGGGVVFRPAATLKKSEGWAIVKITNP
ncbi:DUF5017 domain-containing protein [Pedobacter glucosidilyticus]|uniref:DUF5017 domain-containing protein n=1 Tax=Pedobacter glucosidilyticus TaxID=1122941 RepID=UPI00041B3632|nr:DUF5017 domain-containing protein [Pedobacter glucosidilyticus]